MKKTDMEIKKKNMTIIRKITSKHEIEKKNNF